MIPQLPSSIYRMGFSLVNHPKTNGYLHVMDPPNKQYFSEVPATGYPSSNRGIVSMGNLFLGR
jgi:hypothetical protein